MLAQGFGKVKKTVTLERKLPAVVKLPGDTYNVTVTATNPKYKEPADKLQAIIETELARYDSQLTVDPKSPSTRIAVNILNLSVPQPTPVQTQPLSFGKNKAMVPQTTGYKVTGTLAVAYQARTQNGRFLDASNLTENFSHEYNTESSRIDESVDTVKKGLNKLRHLGRSSKETEPEEQAPRTVEDVQQLLITNLAKRVAARLVNTNERVEVLLARGELDQYNKYAEAGQWTRMKEELETMTPLPTKAADAYRFYNIGVACEALGYAAETPPAAERNLQDAAANYGKATDADPDEKYFLEPQNRIETALEHFKKLNAPAARAKKAPVSSRTGTHP